MYTSAQNKATQRYMKKAYDEIKLRIPKGQREKLKDYVSSRGYDSVNSYICKLIQDDSSLVMHKI